MKHQHFLINFSRIYEKKENIIKILLCPNKEKLERYLPKTLIDKALTDTMTNYWQYYITKYCPENANVELDAINKIFIVFEVNSGV